MTDNMATFIHLGAANSGAIKCLQIHKQSPRLTHLLFTDDSILFTEVTDLQIDVLMELLTTYGKFSGKLINYKKSAVFFSNNILPYYKSHLAMRLGVSNRGIEGVYLGLPLCILHSKNTTFAPLLSKISSRLL
ncbi:uncharacterized protein LOC126687611 [Mercurialis annua]|uniref:uncharacterized protein LOC126687611 n=1 Tax=Mercurialis annua TaxID=3986 RepID=UPI002160005E|nr:uncharacterized protein LOC126687611 [Mercurialis annua]